MRTPRSEFTCPDSARMGRINRYVGDKAMRLIAV